jgi:hypothetical protein
MKIKKKKISPERQAREVAQIEAIIAAHEDKIRRIRAGLNGARRRLRMVKRGFVPIV